MEIAGTKSIAGIHKAATDKVVNESTTMLRNKGVDAGKLSDSGHGQSKFSVRHGGLTLYCTVAVSDSAFVAYISPQTLEGRGERETVKFSSLESIVSTAMKLNNKIEREYLKEV